MADLKTYYYETTHGHNIFVEECGSGPLMVLMHGLGGSTNSFQPLISHFSLSYTMLRFDFPGSAFSQFKTPPNIPQFLECLMEILEAHPASDPPVLVGHSLGSIIAMHYASVKPTRALVLIGPGRSASHMPDVVERMSRLAASSREGLQGIRDITIANNVAPTSSDLVRTIVRQMISSQDAEGYAVTCEAVCSKSHVDPDYSEIKCPVVLIAGDQDKISPLSRSEELRELIGYEGESQIVQLAVVHSGHQQVLEDTSGVIKAMESILAL